MNFDDIERQIRADVPGAHFLRSPHGDVLRVTVLSRSGEVVKRARIIQAWAQAVDQKQLAAFIEAKLSA
jgi:hypothetical protein